MSSGLSIAAAANERPGDCALLVDGKTYSFAQLAQQCAALRLPEQNVHRTQGALQSALLLYKSLDESRPLCLVSDRLSNEEWQLLLRRIPPDLPAEIALVLFTSGSSGQTKGVKLSRLALACSARASEERHGWFGQDRWLCALPLSHVGGLSILLRCLMARKTVLLCEGFGTGEVAEAITEQGITHISLVPTMLWRLLEAGFRAPKHLRVTLMGGAAVDPALAERASAAGFRLQLSYGMTETASQILVDGRALDGVQLRVRDERLEIKAPMLMDGYLAPHEPEAIGDSWFRTEDRASIAEDGHVRIHGRADDIIISGGENIDPRAIEAALNKSPLIRASYVLGLDHKEWGQELVALVVTRSAKVSDALKTPALKGHRKPKALIPVAALPLLDNGKIDHEQAHKIALRRRTED